VHFNSSTTYFVARVVLYNSICMLIQDSLVLIIINKIFKKKFRMMIIDAVVYDKLMLISPH